MPTELSTDDLPTVNHPAGLDHVVIAPHGILLCADDGSWGIPIGAALLITCDLPQPAPNTVHRRVPVEAELARVTDNWEYREDVRYVIVAQAVLDDFRDFCKRAGFTNMIN